MYGLTVWDDAGGWQPIELDWHEQHGWRYRHTPHTASFLFFQDAQRAARQLAHHCGVKVAVLDPDRVHHVFVAPPPAMGVA